MLLGKINRVASFNIDAWQQHQVCGWQRDYLAAAPVLWPMKTTCLNACLS